MKSREHRSGLFTVRLLPAIYRLRIVSCFLCANRHLLRWETPQRV
jgi:hypothetical protein